LTRKCAACSGAIDDAIEADRGHHADGDEVEPRREFIEQTAARRNIDI
jgi:DNA gyrase/topoisomerase IV subunit B